MNPPKKSIVRLDFSERSDYNIFKKQNKEQKI